MDSCRRTLSADGLDRVTRVLASIHALVVVGDEDQLLQFMRIALDDGVEVDRIREILLQSVLFAGIPRSINAFSIFQQEVESRGLDDGPASSLPLPPDPDEISAWARRGEALFRSIYPRNHREVTEDLKKSHPELRRNVLLGAYGQILSRDVLAPRERELCAVGALVILRTPRQLVAHIRGARHVGATLDEIREVISQMALHVHQRVVDRSLLYFDRIKREL